MNKLLSCRYNMDTNRVEARFEDETTLAIDCIAIEDEYGNYYGTLKEEVNKRLNAGKLVVMVIDVHGAANIRRMYPGATTIFLLPPSTQELERRLRGRGTETEESIRERLEIARNELAQQDKFTLKLVNDEVDACAARLYDVICQRAGLTR